CRESQQRTWGDVDNAVVGRYLAGEASPQECEQVERALAELPELRKLTALVRDVLDDFRPEVLEPAAPRAVPAVEPAAPGILPFSSTRPVPRRRALARVSRRYGSIAAAACF